MKLLIVEDNAGIRRILRRVLVDTASTIWECADGSEALAAYERALSLSANAVERRYLRRRMAELTKV